LTAQLFQTLQFISAHPINKGRRIRAFGKFVRWQIRSRLAPGPVVFTWVNDSKLIARSGETGVTGNIYCGLHEFEEMAYLLHVTTAEDLFVDVGANVGTYTILACAVKGARGISVEPVPATYGRLLENLSVNGLSGRVEALNLGLADKVGELRFTSGENTMNHVVTEEERASDTVRVRVVTLDAMLNGRCPAVLKIDVEGFEAAVLAGASATLSNPSLHSVIMELNESGSRYRFSEDEILDTMKSHGFSTCRYEPFARLLESFAGRRSLTGNMLFVRNLELARERIKTAPSVLVDGLRL